MILHEYHFNMDNAAVYVWKQSNGISKALSEECLASPKLWKGNNKIHFFCFQMKIFCSWSLFFQFLCPVCFGFEDALFTSVPRHQPFNSSLYQVQYNNVDFCNYQPLSNEHHLHLMSACSVLPSILIAVFHISDLSVLYPSAPLHSLILTKSSAANKLLGHFLNILELYC